MFWLNGNDKCRVPAVYNYELDTTNVKAFRAKNP
jgi:hypothetical protein